MSDTSAARAAIQEAIKAAETLIRGLQHAEASLWLARAPGLPSGDAVLLDRAAAFLANALPVAAEIGDWIVKVQQEIAKLRKDTANEK